MSARQNKKRKSKVIRERTFTTLTGTDELAHPNPAQLSYLALPSAEDISVTPNIMSSPFSVASSSGGGGSTNVPLSAGYQIPSNFPAFRYNSFMPPMHPSTMPHQQSQYYSEPSTPTGSNDLETLEQLKQTIKNNQHEVFRAVPQPEVLRSLVKNVIDSGLSSSVPPHPEQIPRDGYQGGSYPKGDYGLPPQQRGHDHPVTSPTGLSGSGSAGDLGRARNSSNPWDSSSGYHRKPNDSYGGPGSTNGQPHASGRYDSANGHRASPEKNGNDYPVPPDSKQALSGNGSEPSRDLSRSGSGQTTVNVKPEEPPFRASESGYARGSVHGPPGKSDEKDDPRSRESGWLARDGPPEGRRRADSDRQSYSSNRYSTANDPRPGPPEKNGPPRDQRFYDRDREPERDRDRERDKCRERDWETRERGGRGRGSWTDWHSRDDRRGTEFKRPPPEERHYEPRSERRWEPRPDVPAGEKRPERPLPVDDRYPRPPAAADRVADDRSTGVPSRIPADDRSTGVPSRIPADDRMPSGAFVDDRRPVPPTDVRIARPSGSSLTNDSAPPAASTDQRPPRAAVPLEERISRAPSLQERISAAPVSTARPDEHLARPAPTLEERVSLASDSRPIPTRANEERPHPSGPSVNVPSASDRNDRPPSGGDRFQGPHGDRRPPPPTLAPAFTRAPSVARDDSRTAATRPVTPSMMPPARPPMPPSALQDMRGREPSRERPSDYRPYNRTEFDRPLEEDRRSEHLDVDSAERYPAARPPPFSRRYPPDERDVPPPERAHAWAPGSPRADPFAGDADRRRDYGDWYRWADDRSYWDKERAAGREQTWERPSYRDYLPPRYDDRSAGWEERDRRYPSAPDTRPYESRPLSARLGETFPPPPDDRASFVRPPSFDPASRVRPRSPSPAPRDDMRPPMKRAREEGYGPGYYSPPPGLGKDAPPRRGTPPLVPVPPPAEYPSPVGPPMGRYYENGNGGYRDSYGAYDRRPVGRDERRI